MKKRNLLKALLAATLVCATVVIAKESSAVKGNEKSKIYHKSACRHYAAKSTTVEFKTEGEALKAGYKACKRCSKAKGKAKPAKKAEAPKKK